MNGLVSQNVTYNSVFCPTREHYQPPLLCHATHKPGHSNFLHYIMRNPVGFKRCKNAKLLAAFISDKTKTSERLIIFIVESMTSRENQELE